MQLKIQRSQRAGGVLAGTIYFCLDVRADYTPQETDNIRKYKLGSQVIYNSQAARRHLDHADAQLDRTQSGGFRDRAAGLARGAYSLAMAKLSLNISIGSLGRGHHIECKDLDELIEAEETVRNACKSVTQYLKVAESFDGGQTIIEYVDGEERIHIEQNAPPLLEYQAAAAPVALIESYEPSGPAFDVGKWTSEKAQEAGKLWLTYERKIADWLEELFPAPFANLYQYTIRAFAIILLLFLLYEVL